MGESLRRLRSIKCSLIVMEMLACAIVVLSRIFGKSKLSKESGISGRIYGSIGIPNLRCIQVSSPIL